MPVLHLGVEVVPYNDPLPPVKRGRKPSVTNGTTGDVAERLEDKYHIMRVFYEQHKSDVAIALENSLKNTLEDLLRGTSSSGVSPLGEGESKIQTAFKKFLSEQEMDRLGIPGIPTKASLLGIGARKRGTPRPSFIDTGLYETSFKAWVD